MLSVADHDATKVTTTETHFHDLIETDGFAISFDYEPEQAADLATLLQDTGADDISVLGSSGKHLRTHLE